MLVQVNVKEIQNITAKLNIYANRTLRQICVFINVHAK